MPILTRDNLVKPLSPALMDPDSFADPFSIVQELESNSNQFNPGQEKRRQIKIRRFPGYLKMALNIIRPQCSLPRTPSLNLTICACVYHGIKHFYDDSECKSLSHFKSEFKRNGVNAPDIHVYEYFQEILDSFPLEIPGTMAKASAVSVVLSEALYNQVSNVSDVFSIDKGALVVLCCIRAVSLQNGECNEAHKELASETWELFQKRIRMARRLAEGLRGSIRQ